MSVVRRNRSERNREGSLRPSSANSLMNIDDDHDDDKENMNMTNKAKPIDLNKIVVTLDTKP